MSLPVPDTVHAADQSQDEELVVTIANWLVKKIERIDNTTHTRKELSAEEYAEIEASYNMMYYSMYYMGIRDYAQAVASGNAELAQAYFQGMSAFFGAAGQT